MSEPGRVLSAIADLAPGGTVLEMRNVFCVHRTGQGDAAALQGTNLELTSGELLCVLGPSGAGKSTLLRVIAGLQLPSAGAVNVLGQDIGRISARARARLRHQQLGLLGQSSDSALPPALPAGRAVELPLALRAVPPRARQARVRELLEAAGLSERSAALPAELSGGERQRFALCAALAHRPALLLADEPTGELDEASAQAIRCLIVSLARRAGTSVIVASHDGAIAEVADRCVRLRDGRVVQERHHGEDALVIDRGGWTALPPELLARGGFARRARVRLSERGLMLTPLAAPPTRPAADARASAPSDSAARAHGDWTGKRGSGGWTPARVQLRAVSRSYRSGRCERLVIESLTHCFAPGGLTVITGRSGSGKTTLLRILAALDRPDAGELLIDERPTGDFDSERLATLRRERIGYMPQEPAPTGFLSAEENIALALRVRGSSQADASAQARRALARAGLAERAAQRLSRLSAGETQRVALARALASARGLLIADEPTSRLDEASTSTAARLLAQAAADGHTVICATHDPAVIAHAQAVLVLGTG
ncbi:MAG: ATP-binding cassette domain-containing protein [Solirubrobacteraceae bacterium]